MPEEPETLEDIAADMLTGVMVFLLGAAIPTFFVWMAVSGRIDWTVGLSFDSLVAASTVVSGSIVSFRAMRWGLRIIRKSMMALRRRRPRSVAG